MNEHVNGNSIWGIGIKCFIDGYPVEFSYREGRLEIVTAIVKIGQTFFRSEEEIESILNSLKEKISGYLRTDITFSKSEEAEIIMSYVMWSNSRYKDMIYRAIVPYTGIDFFNRLKEIFGEKPIFEEINKNKRGL